MNILDTIAQNTRERYKEIIKNMQSQMIACFFTEN